MLEEMQKREVLPPTVRKELAGLSANDIWALSSFNSGAINLVSTMKPAQKVAARVLIDMGLLAVQPVGNDRRVQVTDLGKRLLQVADSLLD